MIIYTNKYNGARPVAIPSVAFPCHANRLCAAVVFSYCRQCVESLSYKAD